MKVQTIRVLSFISNVLMSKSTNNQVLSFMCNVLEYESTNNQILFYVQCFRV